MNGETEAELDYKNTTSATFDVADEVDGENTAMIGFVGPNQTIVTILDHRTQWFHFIFSKNSATGPVTLVDAVKAPYYNGACIFEAMATTQL